MYICLCKGIDEETLQQYKKKGLDTLQKVSKHCGAGADCGTCAFKINRILKAEDENELKPDLSKNPAS